MTETITNEFVKTVELSKDRLYRICTVYSTESCGADDLLQEAILNAWRALPRFREDASLSTWIYRIVINTCLKNRAYDQRNKRFLRAFRQHLVTEWSAPTGTGDDLARQKLRACLRTLNESERSLVVLYLEDLPYREIAAVTGLSENHVAVKIKRIKQKLYNCIESKK